MHAAPEEADDNSLDAIEDNASSESSFFLDSEDYDLLFPVEPPPCPPHCPAPITPQTTPPAEGYSAGDEVRGNHGAELATSHSPDNLHIDNQTTQADATPEDPVATLCVDPGGMSPRSNSDLDHPRYGKVKGKGRGDITIGNECYFFEASSALWQTFTKISQQHACLPRKIRRTAAGKSVQANLQSVDEVMSSLHDCYLMLSRSELEEKLALTGQLLDLTGRIVTGLTPSTSTPAT